MEKIAEKLTNYIKKKGKIGEEDYGIYKYGFQTGLELLLCMVIILLVATFMGKILECILLILVFFSQRAYVEGIHMKRFSACFFVSCGVLIGGLKFLEIQEISEIFMLLVVIICLLSIYQLSKISVQKIENNTEKQFFSKQRRRILILIALASIICYLFHFDTILRIIFYTEIVMLFSTGLRIFWK